MYCTVKPLSTQQGKKGLVKSAARLTAVALGWLTQFNEHHTDSPNLQNASQGISTTWLEAKAPKLAQLLKVSFFVPSVVSENVHDCCRFSAKILTQVSRGDAILFTSCPICTQLQNLLKICSKTNDDVFTKIGINLKPSSMRWAEIPKSGLWGWRIVYLCCMCLHNCHGLLQIPAA